MHHRLKGWSDCHVVSSSEWRLGWRDCHCTDVAGIDGPDHVQPFGQSRAQWPGLPHLKQADPPAPSPAVGMACPAWNQETVILAADRQCSQTPFSARQGLLTAPQKLATGPPAKQGCTCGGHHAVEAAMMGPAALPGSLHVVAPAGPLSASWGLLPARTCRPSQQGTAAHKLNYPALFTLTQCQSGVPSWLHGGARASPVMHEHWHVWSRRCSTRTCIILVGPGKAQAALILCGVGALDKAPPIVAFSPAGRTMKLPGSVLPAEVSGRQPGRMPHAVWLIRHVTGGKHTSSLAGCGWIQRPGICAELACISVLSVLVDKMRSGQLIPPGHQGDDLKAVVGAQQLRRLPAWSSSAAPAPA